MHQPVPDHFEHQGLVEQALYTQFVQEFNTTLIDGSLASYSRARVTAAQLKSLTTNPEISSSLEAMLEQLEWLPEAMGDIESGEVRAPEGYPYNRVWYGDSKDLITYVPDKSINLIFTDPPYIKDQMYLYGWLAKEADRVLADDGFLMAYVGNYWKDEAMAYMREHMSYFWDYSIIHGGNHPLQRNRSTRAATKSVLCYRKGGSSAQPNQEIVDAYSGQGEDKDHHHWGQPVDEAEYYIKAFSREGDLVLDPFIGGGTTAAACNQVNRKWVGFEKDPKHASTAQERVGKI